MKCQLHNSQDMKKHGLTNNIDTHCISSYVVRYSLDCWLLYIAFLCDRRTWYEFYCSFYFHLLNILTLILLKHIKEKGHTEHTSPIPGLVLRRLTHEYQEVKRNADWLTTKPGWITNNNISKKFVKKWNTKQSSPCF